MGFHMSVPDEVRHDAEKTGELVRKKLMEIMELQADIDALLRDDHPTPFGSKNWQYACPGSPATPCGNDGDPVRPFRAGGEG